jgi:hypothetical protein
MIMRNLVITVPLPGGTGQVQKEVSEILANLAPIVAQRVIEARHKSSARLLDALLEGVTPRAPDMKLARMEANAIQAILEQGVWLTAQQIGELGHFSKSNFAAPANRWKNERKLFAVEYDGQHRFPRYALDENYRPLPAVQAILLVLGKISDWRIAAWFESSNAWLDNRRPREVLATAPEAVIAAAQQYRSGAHG